MEISHLFYANDMVLLSPWSFENVNKIGRILWCFYLALGHRINMYKSKLICVRVNYSQFEKVVGMVGCVHASLPFIH